MKKYIILISILIFITSCGMFPFPKIDIPKKKPLPPQDPIKVEELNNILLEFNTDYNYHYNQIDGTDMFGFILGPSHTSARWSKGNLPQGFADLQDSHYKFGVNVVGVCFWRHDGSRDIIYDNEWWNKLTMLQKKELVYHENGHCQFNRAHRCSSINNNGDKGIMNPYLHQNSQLNRVLPIDHEYYSLFFNYIKLELFSKQNQKINDCGSTSNTIITHDEQVIIDTYEDVFGHGQ